MMNMTGSQTIEVIKELTGHSGCSVQLCLRGDRYFVRKISSSPSYNIRLKRQADKQVALSRFIPTPEVYIVGEIGELAYFDMEYVRGHGFISFAPLQSVKGICDIVESLCASISSLAATRTQDLEAVFFARKLDELARTVPASPFFAAHESFLDQTIDTLRHKPWKGVPKTFCHGDLTVENMMLKDNGGIVFIDMLDGELESVWLDIAKLLQDLHSGWSLRSLLWAQEPAPSDRLLRTLTRYLADEIETQMARNLPQFAILSHDLRALQALRVLPYVKDAVTFQHVVSGLKELTIMKEFA